MVTERQEDLREHGNSNVNSFSSIRLSESLVKFGPGSSTRSQGIFFATRVQVAKGESGKNA
ncbi:hypothetical protein SAMN05414139_02708 [Burkholderia sp. D7]|nr:hypothetical protein SAMN05414139_02708 [Burkholderia sp. D7]